MRGYDAVSEIGWVLTFVAFAGVFAVLFRGITSLFRISVQFCKPDGALHLNIPLFRRRD